MSKVTELSIVISGTPPNANHYVKHARGHHYRTQEAKDWDSKVAVVLQGRHVTGKSFVVDVDVYQGAGEKGDADGYLKCLLDALQRAGAFRSLANGRHLSDAHVMGVSAYKYRDRKNPRTIVRIFGYESEPHPGER